MVDLSFEDRMQAEYIVYTPSHLNNFTFTWEIFLPHITGQPAIAKGYGRDSEHCYQCAQAALRSLQRYGNDSCLFN